MILKRSTYQNRFLKLTKRNLYFDNLNTQKNLDFVFNLGYNKIPSIIDTNLNIFKTLRFITRNILISRFKKDYIELLNSIESGNLKNLEKILDPQLNKLLLSELAEFSGKGYIFEVKNKNSPIFVKVINTYEFTNVKVDREKNDNIEKYEIMFKSRNKLVFRNVKDKNTKLSHRKALEFEENRKKFYDHKDEYKRAYQDLKNTLELEYDVNYIKSKIGPHPENSKLEFYSNLISTLKRIESEKGEEANIYKNEYKDYYDGKEEYLKNKIESTDLFIYYYEKMQNNYQMTFKKKKNEKGIIKGIKNLLLNFKEKFSEQFNNLSLKFNKDYNKLFIFDIELASKTRLDIVDENKLSILEKEYNYSNAIKRSLNLIEHNNDLLDYDTSLYKFKANDYIWDINNPEYIQRHLIRFEYERKSFLQFMNTSPLDSLKITDIDISLKGNKHFTFSDRLGENLMNK